MFTKASRAGLYAQLLCIAALPVVFSSNTHAAVPGDYTGDGKSDLAVATVNRSSDKTTWFFNDLTGNFPQVTVNNQGDALVPGDYDGNGTVDPAIVFVRSDGRLVWHVITPSGEFVEVFGSNGDQPMSGDFDCDGVADRALARRESSRILWYIKRTSAGYLRDYRFGLPGDKLFVADVNGDGCDELIASRIANGQRQWWFETVGEGTDRLVQYGLANDIPVPPADTDGDGAANFIVARVVGKSLVAYIRSWDESTSTVTIGQKGDIPLTGYFAGNQMAQLGVYRRGRSGRASTFILKLPSGDQRVSFGNSSSTLIRPDHTVVQSDDNGTNSGGGENSDSSDGVGTCQNIKSIDKVFNVLYKPINEHGGRGPTLIVKNPSEKNGKRKIEIRDMNCKLIGYLGLFADAPPWGARYYSRSGGSGYSHTQLKSKALAAGSSAILIEGKNKWLKINDPTVRQPSGKLQ